MSVTINPSPLCDNDENSAMTGTAVGWLEPVSFSATTSSTSATEVAVINMPSVPGSFFIEVRYVAYSSSGSGGGYTIALGTTNGSAVTVTVIDQPSLNCSVSLVNSGNSLQVFASGLAANWHISVTCKFGN